MKKVYYSLLISLFALYLLQYTLAASAPQQWRKHFPWATVKAHRELSAIQQPAATADHRKSKGAIQLAQAYLKDWQESVTALLAEPVNTNIVFTIAATPASCNATADGAFTLSGISGGTRPYQVSLDGGKTYRPDTIFHQMAAGVYPVMVKDALGQLSAVQESVVGLQQEISFQVIFKNAGCDPNAGGEIVFHNPAGGTAPYTYSIDGGQTFGPVPGFSQLAAGQYQVLVKDAMGCSSQPHSLTLQQLKPMLAVSSTGTTSNGSSTGTITAQASSSIAAGGELMSLAWGQPESFQTYAKSFSPITNVSELHFNQSSAAVTGQPVSYAIEVYNAAGSVWEKVYSYGLWEEVYANNVYSSLLLSNLNISFPVKSTVSGVRLSSDASYKNLFRNFFGTVLAFTGTDNTPETYSFSIDGGTTFQNSGHFTGLRAGTYTVLARNSKGCLSQQKQVAIADPGSLALAISLQNPTCTQPESGTITLQASGGTVIPPTANPYAYDLLWPGPDSFNSIVVPFTSTLTNLSRISFPGQEYWPGAQVRPLDGQQLHYKLDLYNPGKGVWENVYTAQTLEGDFFAGNSISFSPLAQASQLRFSASDPVNPVFSGFNNLQIRLEGTKDEGGTSYQYSIDGGVSYQSGNVFTGLPAGTYPVAVKDARGTVKTDTVQLAVGAPCANLAFAVQTLATSCAGTPDGTITLTALAGGRRPYQFSPDSGKTYQPDSVFYNLAAGSYPVVIKDALGRVSPVQQAHIESGKAISFHLVFENPDCSSTASGKITINSPAGGAAPYAYSIDGGTTFSSGNEFTDLPAGQYQLQVKDAAGCRSKSQLVSLQTSEIMLSVNPVHAGCAGSSTGSIQLTAGPQPLSGGAMHHLAWGTPASFQSSSRSFAPVPNADTLRLNPSNAQVGLPGVPFTYSIEVYNAQTSVWENVYSYSDTGVLPLSVLEVALPQKPAVSGIRLSSSSPAANVFQGFDAATFTVTGRSQVPETYAYSIDAGKTFLNSGLFPGLAAGTYTVLARNSKGCSSESRQVTIQEPPALALNIEKQNASCLDQASGSIVIHASGGTVVPPRNRPVGSRLSWPGPNDFNTITVPFSTPLDMVEKISFHGNSYTSTRVGSPDGQPLTYTIDLYNPAKAVWENVYSAQTSSEDYFIDSHISFQPTPASQIRFSASSTNNAVFHGFNNLYLVLEGTLQEGGVSYQYSINGGQTYQAGNTFPGLPAGTYPVAVKDANGCVITDTVRIELPRIAVRLDPMTAVCLSRAPFELTGGSPAGGFYRGKGVSSNIFDPRQAGAGNHQITYVYRNDAGCIDSASTTLAVLALPESGLDQDSLLLASGESRQIGGAPVSGYTYRWQPAAGLSDSTLANPVLRWVNPSLQALSRAYRLTVTNSAGCALTDTLRVKVLPGMQAYAGRDTAVCAGSPVRLGQAARAGFSYHWSPATSLSDAGVADPEARPLHTTAYLLTITETATGLQDQDSVTITVNPPPGLSVTPIAPVYRVGDTLNLRASSSSGAAYRWTGPNGYSSTAQNLSIPNVTEAMSGTYSVTAMVNGCSSAAASVTVTIHPSDPVTLALDSVKAYQQAEILIPIRASEFKHMLSLQGSIEWNSTVASFVGVESFNLAGLTSANFGQTKVANGQLTFSWHDPTATAATLPDGAVIFALKLKLIGAPGTGTAVTITNTPTPVEVTNSSYTAVPVTTKAGAAIIYNEVWIAGSVKSPLGTPLSKVTVKASSDASTQNTTTSGTGGFTFKVTEGKAYALAPVSRQEVDKINGITTLDLVHMQRHILNNQLLNSPYRIIAADVNNSGSVTTLDMVLIRALILHNIASFPNNRMWAFVKSDFSFANSSQPFPYDSTRTYSNVSLLNNQDFIGIKLGDVNDSWDATRSRSEVVGELVFKTEGLNAAPGSEVTIPVKVSDFTDVSGYQFTLNWDPHVLAFSGVEHGSVEGVYGTHSVGKGKLTTVWVEPEGKSLSLRNGTKVFGVRFKVLGHPGSASKMEISSSLTSSVAYTGNLQQLNIVSPPALVKVKQAAYALYQNYPNPFSEQTRLHFELPEAQSVELTIYNALGQVVRQFQGQYQAGEHFVTWYGEDALGNQVSRGAYFCRMKAGTFSHSIRILHAQ